MCAQIHNIYLVLDISDKGRYVVSILLSDKCLGNDLFRWYFRQQSSNSDSKRTAGQRGRYNKSRGRRTGPSSTAAASTQQGHRLTCHTDTKEGRTGGLEITRAQDRNKKINTTKTNT